MIRDDTTAMLTRRRFLADTGRAGLAAALAAPLTRADESDDPPKGKADSCIFLWLGGGAAHIDTFDPKRRGDPAGAGPPEGGGGPGFPGGGGGVASPAGSPPRPGRAAPPRGGGPRPAGPAGGGSPPGPARSGGPASGATSRSASTRRPRPTA